VLVLSIALALLIAGSAAAADETAPMVDVPEDVLGADVIVFFGDAYDFDASSSTDDTGIVNFMWEFNDGLTPVTLFSTTGKTSYTFSSYGQTWVIVHAWDAAGNEGFGYFAIDVVELITTDSIIENTVGIIPHTLYLKDADLTIKNSTVYMDDGAGTGPHGGGAGAPDTLGESLTPDGDLAGHWEPYYWNNYWRNNNRWYGRPYLDTSIKMSGEASIKIADGYYIRGMEYHFNTNADLTEYNALTFWMHSNYPSDYNYLYQVYFYGDHGYSSTYGYAYQYAGAYQQGGYSHYRGWHGYTIPLDIQNTGRFYMYRMSDLSSIAAIRIYTYSIYNRYAYGYAQWIDNVGFSQVEWADDITENVNPTGDMSGRWSSSYSSPSTSSRSYVGDYSIYFPMTRYRYIHFYYYFDSPADLSEALGMRYFSYHSGGSNARYQRTTKLRVYDDSGHYAYYRGYSSQYFYYGYGDWFMNSHAWGAQAAYYNNGIDWTKITQIQITDHYQYYPYSGGYYIDGLEWYGPGAGGVKTDSIPYSIIVDGGDLTIEENSYIQGTGKVGARIFSKGGNTRLQHSTFDNIWHSESPAIKNGLKTYGGVEVYGDAVIDNVTFLNCNGPGLALYDGTWTVDKDTVDLHGTSLKVKGSPMLILGVSEMSTGNVNMDVTGWVCEDSPSGTGILVSTESTTASITVTISDNEVDNNKYAGIVVSNYGSLLASPMEASATADLDLVVKDQVIEDAGSYGLVYYAGGGEYDPNVWGTIWIENVTVRKSGEAGLGVWLDMGGTNLDATIINSTFERNSGHGAGFMFTSFFGECNIDIENTTFRDNSDAGLYIHANQAPYNDGLGNIISPVANIDITMNATSLQGNSGWGFVEDLNGYDEPEGGTAPPWTWTGPTRTTLWYNLTMTLSEILENQAGGWDIEPSEGWFDSNQVANREVSETTIVDNRGSGLFMMPNHDLRGGGAVQDVISITDCRIIDNSFGVDHVLGYDNFGYYSEVHLTDTRIEDNDGESITVVGSWSTDGVFRWGNSRVLGVMYYIDGCRINTPMYMDLMGADDSGREDWDAIMGLQFTNNIVDVEDEDTKFFLGAYPYSNDFTAWAEIGDNKFYRGYIENGLHLEMFGGWNLNMDVNVFDLDIDEPMGSGLNFLAGTLVPSSNPHTIGGSVMIDNVTVKDAGSNGINFTINHKEWIGAKSLATLEVHDMMMDNVNHGIIANDLRGAIYDTIVYEPRSSTIEMVYCTFDFYSCDVGAVDTSNIKVLTKGAARLWYDVGVDVKWAGGARVLGAVVSVQDNTWTTIAVDTVDSDDVLGIGYVNSYTVLPDTVYSKSPFLLTGTYLGLTTEKSVDIKSNTVVDLILVDDVLPRLTVNMPMDGSKQRDTSLTVKGHAWDQHSGLMDVMVSIDNGFTWMTAMGAPDFEYTYNMVPEGNLLVMVKAIDQAGNERMEVISVLVDATPPTIIIIEPKNDVILTQDPVLSIIGVTELGATVLVDNEQVSMDHTLFSTEVMLTEGMNEVRIVALDRLGNSAEHVIEVELDTIAPPLIVTDPMEGITIGKRSIRVYGQTEAGAMVYVDGQMAAIQLGSFSHTAILNEGPNMIMVTSEDAAGNKATVTVEIMVDTTVPWLELSSPMEGDVFGSEGINIVGWVEDGSAVTVNDQEVAVENAYFSTNIMGSEGRNIIVVSVYDRAGNEYSENVEVWFDTTAPAIELWTPAEGFMTAEDTVEVSGMLLWNEERESFRDITLSINGDFAPFAADGEFRIQYDLVEGTNPLFIRATDDVGNSVVTTVTVMKDSMAPFLLVEPVPTFEHPTWNKPSTYKGLVYIVGTTEPGAMVTVDGAGVEVDATGQFNVSVLLGSVPDNEELLQHSIVVVSTDAAGNSKEDESAQYWVLFLSIVILVVAIVAAMFLWRRIGAPDEEYDDDLYLEEV
jgi:hypothetical protein